MLNLPRMRLVFNTGRLVRPANYNKFQAAGVHTTRAVQSEKPEQKPHTTDSYAKDVDTSPVADGTVHRVDPDSDRVQRPYEPPSGYSRAGVQHEEYRHVEGEKQPYAPTGGQEGNYGSMPNWEKQKGKETSNSDEGPDAKSSKGRK